MGKQKSTPPLRFPIFKGEWQKREIGEAIDFLSGFPFDGDAISNDSKGIPLMRGINITEGLIRHLPEIDKFYCGDITKLEKYFLKEGDLVIGMDGSKVGKNSALIESKDANSILVQRVARLREKEGASLSFIYHHINSFRFHKYVDEVKTSSGIPHISATQIKNFKIFFPSLPEQKKVASFITDIDKKILGLKQKDKLLQKYKNGVIQKIFSQELRFKNEEGKDFPKWEKKKLGEIGEFKNGINKAKEDFGFGYPFINLMDVFGKPTISDLNLGLVNANEKERKIYELKKGDVLFIRSSVKKSGVGETSLVLRDLKDTVYSGFLIRFRDDKIKLDLNFKRYCFSTKKFREDLMSVSSTSANTNINQESLNDLEITLPSFSEQTKISNFLSAIDEKINQNQTQLVKTEEYKTGILQNMFC